MGIGDMLRGRGPFDPEKEYDWTTINGLDAGLVDMAKTYRDFINKGKSKEAANVGYWISRLKEAKAALVKKQAADASAADEAIKRVGVTWQQQLAELSKPAAAADPKPAAPTAAAQVQQQPTKPAPPPPVVPMKAAAPAPQASPIATSSDLPKKAAPAPSPKVQKPAPKAAKAEKPPERQIAAAPPERKRAGRPKNPEAAVHKKRQQNVSLVMPRKLVEKLDGMAETGYWSSRSDLVVYACREYIKHGYDEAKVQIPLPSQPRRRPGRPKGTGKKNPRPKPKAAAPPTIPKE